MDIATYRPHSIVMTGLTLHQLDDVTMDRNFADFIETSGAEVFPQWAGSESAEPGISGTTKQVADLIALCTDYDVSVDLSAGNVDLQYRKATRRGHRTALATTVHKRARLTSNCLLYWESIQAQQGQSATISFRLMPEYDRSNAPIIWTPDVALSGASAVQEVYTLGPITINGDTITLVQSATYSSGVQAESIAGDGDPFPVLHEIDGAAPSLVFETRNLDVIDDFGPEGTELTAFTGYLRARAKFGINTAVASAAHVKAVAVDGVVKARSSKSKKATAEVFIQFTAPDDSTAPLVWSTGVAIT